MRAKIRMANWNEEDHPWVQAGSSEGGRFTTKAGVAAWKAAGPCTRALTQTEIETGYELNTGKAIVETFRQKNLDALEMPAVLVSKHGPFTWGMDVSNAVENSVVLEAVAQMAWLTEGLAPEAQPAPGYLLEKHYSRKHGPNAYYGQK